MQAVVWVTKIYCSTASFSLFKCTEWYSIRGDYGSEVTLTFKKPHSKSTSHLCIRLYMYLFSKVKPQEILSFLICTGNTCPPCVTSPKNPNCGPSVKEKQLGVRQWPTCFYWFPGVAIMKYHRPGGLNNGNELSQFWRLEVRNQGVGRAGSFWGP